MHLNPLNGSPFLTFFFHNIIFIESWGVSYHVPQPHSFPIPSISVFHPCTPQKLVKQNKTKQKSMSSSSLGNDLFLISCSVLCRYHPLLSFLHLHYKSIHHSGIGGCSVSHGVAFSKSAQTALLENVVSI